MALTFLSDVKKRLEEDYVFRERKNKNVGIADMLVTKHNQLYFCIEAGLITEEQLVRVLKDYASLDRAWRKCLEEYPYLRGTDYKDKDKLEQEVIEKVRTVFDGRN